MFFIAGISQGRKDLDFLQTIVCKRCGRLSSISVFATYMYFSFFFIPIFKWNKQYYAVSSCCQTPFSIDKELGQAIERGERVDLTHDDLHFVDLGYAQASVCPDCGYRLDSEHIYCPKCGRKVN
ncbi:zinc ribbon domain-containing protein [Chakrabartyella piscis]|uniref:zinc ribbon domain-containing protein n=1 Tax=Chakrabartyella piscis TaxID=2918914 RepID=UPI0029588284|nr:zinc ribbon domain-containing protein [Chakrabartyella piscis]